MPRSKRMLYDGAVYHIVQRGYNKDKLFKKPQDYRFFKDIIRKYKKRFVFDIYHYCLMSNHIHLLLKVENGNDLPRILQGITQSYSFYYRKAYSYVGYVYQNRYKSLLIEDDSYLLECGRYIERNPLRAGIVKDLSQYYWSSYNFYAKDRFDDILTINPLCDSFGTTAKEKMLKYHEYVLQPRPYENVLDDALVG
ncbi:MAG: transposase [Candidatus Omnitrophica bacterium]|nr:transposase [Candidatus Omnitrophota bacterium]